MKKTAYIILTKIPEPGYVKTRLSPMLSATTAAKIQRAMLRHLIGQCGQLRTQMDTYLVYQGQTAAVTQQFLQNLPSWLQTFPQITGTLGEKMSTAIAICQQQGYQHILLSGSDIPELSTTIIRRADQALTITPTVLGPTIDGGYYLFGARQLDVSPFLAADISWSSASVLATTQQLLAQNGQAVTLLPKLQDVDFAADWATLAPLMGE
ncbi:TIGR04282 family arsenosugar biosynthesis glycosyltransferase [Loigolactobacillus jiayinensis]|uniref:TIGR04282 family arsenosugar biosynthesis glycosyltransferase n=1 Tax=Loigolactobacillus jiayinensis TaxID=2486016 RepID=A0ABW1RC08_9LACO|nr:TIGR04282 family arsenosugar biosynthesis glycosyltransferase [Loigolactobacillus jiayinensis]